MLFTLLLPLFLCVKCDPVLFEGSNQLFHSLNAIPPMLIILISDTDLVASLSNMFLFLLFVRRRYV